MQRSANNIRDLIVYHRAHRFVRHTDVHQLQPVSRTIRKLFHGVQDGWDDGLSSDVADAGGGRVGEDGLFVKVGEVSGLFLSSSILSVR